MMKSFSKKQYVGTDWLPPQCMEDPYTDRRQIAIAIAIAVAIRCKMRAQ